MKVKIQDSDALIAVSPASLSAYARSKGWIKVELYGDYADVYTKGGHQEIIVPRTQDIGDYASVMSQLIGIFAEDAKVDELSLYRDLVTSDRDVVRVRADAGANGDVAVKDGIDLIAGARDMLLAVACSLGDTQPVYQSGGYEYKEASRFLNQMRLGQTEQGSFVITLLTPFLDPDWQLANSDPPHRQITRRLAGALAATREAIERTDGKDTEHFLDAMGDGVSANFCNAIVKMVNSVKDLDVSLSWARTLPTPTTPEAVRFASYDVPVLRQAAQSFRDHEVAQDRRLVGIVQRLESDDIEKGGTMILKTQIDGRYQRVRIVLNQSDYQRALQAHSDRSQVAVAGTLRRAGQRWSLLDSRITSESLPYGDTRLR